MAEKEEEYEPKHIKKHKEHYKKAKMIVTTTNRIHRQAYSAGEEAIINEDGLVDKDMLKDDPEKQLEVADKWADAYIRGIEKDLGIKKGKYGKYGDFGANLLMKGFAGITRPFIRDYVGRAQHNISFEVFYEKMRPRLMAQIEETLYDTAGQHLTEKHIKDIVKYTKIGDMIYENQLDKDSALRILRLHHDNEGSITKRDLEGLIQNKQLLPTILRKKKKEEEEKEEELEKAA